MANIVNTLGTGYSLAFDTSGGNEVTCPVPTGVVDGELLVAAMLSHDNENPATFSLPVGWSEAFTNSSVNGTFNIHGVIGTRTASSEPANYTFDFTGAVSQKDKAVYIFRVQNSSGIDVVDYLGNGSDVNVACPAITTANDNSLLLHIAATQQGRLSGSAAYPTSTTGINLAESRNNSSGITVGAAYEDQAVAGLTTQREFVDLVTSNKYGTGFAIAFVDSASSTGPSIDNIDGDNEVRAGQQNVVITGSNIENATSVTLGGEALTIV